MKKQHKENIEKLENILKYSEEELSKINRFDKPKSFDYWFNRTLIHQSQLNVYKTCLNKSPLARNAYDIIH